MRRKHGLTLFGCVAAVAWGFAPVSAQSLRFKIEQVFEEVLDLELAGSPGQHGNHFSPDNVASSDKIIKALTSFIGSNIALFPLSSTGATIIYDLSTGVPVRKTGSLGPVFSEAGTTLGGGRVILGYNFTFMNFNRIRGLEVRDLQFTFTHQDVGAPGLGDSDNELDTIDLFMDMKLAASILAFYFTAGVTDRLDLGFAIPLVNAHVEANPMASINSFTLVNNDSANHFYGGDRTNPQLTTLPTPINDSATGIGDIALRAKLNFYRGRGDLAGLIEVRIPTGDEENFLGSGSTSVKAQLIASRSWSGFTPHVNLSYIFRDSDLDNDDIELAIGYDQLVASRFTLVLDFFGRFQVGETPEALRFDETAVIRRPISNTELVRVVQLTNLPQRDHDHTIDLSLGAKYAPRDFLVLIGNILVSLNDGGLRADVVPTIGFEFNF